MKKRTFKCPDCGCKDIEEVMVSVVQFTVIDGVEWSSDDPIVHYSSDRRNSEGGEVSHYQCFECGYVIIQPGGNIITTPEELFLWIRKAMPISETDVVDVEPITEAQRTREVTENARKASGNRSIDRLEETINKAASKGESYVFSKRLDSREIESIAIIFRQKGFIVETSSPCFLKVSW